jgi:hypothetical protein
LVDAVSSAAAWAEHCQSPLLNNSEKDECKMRNLKTEELTHVYGAGGRGKSSCPPKHEKHARRGSSNGKRRGSGSGHGKRRGSS